MPITKASGNSVTAAAKGDLVVGNATNDSGILSVGSANQVLTVDSSTATGLKWATASSGGMTLLQTLTADGSSATFSFTSISGSYKHLLITGSGIRGSVNAGRGMTFTINNDTGTNYNGVNHGTDGLSGSINGGAVNLGGFMPYSTDATSRYANFELIIYDYATTIYHPMFATAMGTPNGSLYIIKVAAQYNSTTAITRVDLSSGSNVSLGTFKLYGVS